MTPNSWDILSNEATFATESMLFGLFLLSEGDYTMFRIALL
jgi:hypothetical protein